MKWKPRFLRGVVSLMLIPVSFRVVFIRCRLSVSFPVVTFVRRLDGWDLIPLAELPSLSLAATFDVAVNGAFQAQLTLQPVIADTTLLSRPIGRVTDDLLILPSLSGFALYAPPS